VITPATSTITILLVDADPDQQHQQRTWLEHAGYRVLTCSTAREAEASLDVSPIDLVITELMLEHVDEGFTLCYRLKKRRPSLPIMMVTAVTSKTGYEFDASTAEERAWVKADVMLDKPVRPEQIQREIERLLSKTHDG
jgi:DNA-binding response OmpR family regulator